MAEMTMGHLLVNEALPQELRGKVKVMNKKSVKDVLRYVAKMYPDKYPEVLRRLLIVGESAAMSGNFSVSLRDFAPSELKQRRAAKVRVLAQQLIDDQSLNDKDRRKKLTALLSSEADKLQKDVLDHEVKRGNRLAEIVAAGSKGSPGQFNTTVGAPLYFTDHAGNPLPYVVTHSVAEGLDPAEYWASSHGTRKGTISTKMATADAGFFGKKLALAAQRLVVTEKDCGTDNGIMVDGGDHENVGTILQKPVGDIPAGTVLKPHHIKKLRGKQVITRSPSTCQAAEGMCSHCAGIRERGHFPDIGDNIGVSSAMALGERLSQGSLNVKHGGGAGGAGKQYGFEDVERLFEMPKHHIETATVSEVDGRVQRIEDAPGGGAYIIINGQEHWVPNKEASLVKPGQNIEAGDQLSTGIANPSHVARYKGVGAARRKFINQMREVTNNGVSRRNAEVLARAVVKHVRITNDNGPDGTMVDDVLPYDNIVRDYQPRQNSRKRTLTSARGKYLERPTLHYTIGTKVTDGVVNDLKKAGYNNILVNDEPPGFEPDIQRMYAHSSLDPDWMVSLGGYRLKDSLLSSVHRGALSEHTSTSYTPGVARGVGFSEELDVTGKY